MSRSRRASLLLVVAASAVCTLAAACGLQTAPTRAPASSAPVVASSPAGRPSPTRVPEPPIPAPPATTSGPLTKANLPAAGEIGPAFAVYVEPDDAEEGLRSNGASVRFRDPQEVAQGIVPLGCPGLDELEPLPVPSHALERTYRTPQHLAAVALALDYSTPAHAAAMVDSLAEMLSLCTAPASTASLNTPRLVADVHQLDPATLLDTRREVGPDAASTRWDETVVRAGRRVGLVIVERTVTTNVARRQQALANDLRRRLGD